jgi:hypothetical protein
VEMVCSVQRVFRGHLGRKAAKRWALKRAELGAMHALLHATATFIQRCYRGYLGRVYTYKKRMEMAQFIALMRSQEAAGDEEVYWQTHPWQRFKRDQKEWIDKKFRSAHQVQVLGGARLTEEEVQHSTRQMPSTQMMSLINIIFIIYHLIQLIKLH